MAIRELLRNFAAGTVTGVQPDELPSEASPRSWNTALMNVGAGHAIPAKRRGASIVNTAPVTGRPTLIGQAAYYKRSGANLSQFHLLFGNDGSLNTLASGVVSEADSGSPTPFTASDNIPSTASANNLLFMVNGVDKKKFDGVNVREFGIARPTTSGFTAVDSGVAGNPSGDFEFALSYGNSSTGHESSRSDAVSVTVTGKKITIGWDTPPDPQVDQIFLHVRKTSINAEFFRLTVGTTPAVDANGAFGVTGDPITVDVTDTELNALTILSPDTAENEPPPDGIHALAYHQSRLFAIDQQLLYYSKEGFPESFDPDFYEYVNKDDSQKLTGVVSAFGNLIIFKNSSVYQLSGVDPDSWHIDLIDPYVGCTANASICFANGYLYWYSNKGPVRWNGSGGIELIGESLIGPTISADTLNFSALDKVCAVVDLPRQKILFAVPGSGLSRNSFLLPFNYRTSGWDADKWDPFDIASMCAVQDSNGTPWVMMGNYGGRVFKWWDADVDGANLIDGSGNRLTLSGTPTAYTSTSITDSTATFDTDDDGLQELYVYLEDAEGNRVRRRITANTATELTLDSDILITPTSYVIATPDWQHDTRWVDFGDPFARKHLLFLYVQAMALTGGGSITVEVFRDWNLTTAVREMTMSAEGNGEAWDAATWDISAFGSTAGATDLRSRIAKIAKVVRIRVRNQTPNVQMALTKIMIEAQPQGRKS